MNVSRFLYTLSLFLLLTVPATRTQGPGSRRGSQASLKMTKKERAAYRKLQMSESERRAKSMGFDATLEDAFNNPQEWAYKFITIYTLPDWERQYTGQEINRAIEHISNFLTAIKQEDSDDLTKETLQEPLDTLKKQLGKKLFSRIEKDFQEFIVGRLEKIITFNKLPSVSTSRGRSRTLEELEEFVKLDPTALETTPRVLQQPSEPRNLQTITPTEKVTSVQQKQQRQLPTPHQILAALQQTITTLHNDHSTNVAHIIIRDQNITDSPLRRTALSLVFIDNHLYKKDIQTLLPEDQKSIINSRNTLLWYAYPELGIDDIKDIALEEQEKKLYEYLQKTLDDYIRTSPEKPAQQPPLLIGAPLEEATITSTSASGSTTGILKKKGSPQQQKRVQFADEAGRPLTEVREFGPEREEPAIALDSATELYRWLMTISRLEEKTLPENLKKVLAAVKHLKSELSKSDPNQTTINKAEVSLFSLLKPQGNLEQFKTISPQDKEILLINELGEAFKKELATIEQVSYKQAKKEKDRITRLQEAFWGAEILS